MESKEMAALVDLVNDESRVSYLATFLGRHHSLNQSCAMLFRTSD